MENQNQPNQNDNKFNGPVNPHRKSQEGTGGAEYSKNLQDANQQVRENEDASLQDESYAFDEDNTDNEEYHDADEGEDFDLDNDDDFVR